MDPGKVIQIVTKNAFRLELPHYMKSHPVLNISALKRYYRKNIEGRQAEPPPPITDADGFERYYVEKVLSHHKDRHGLKYLVKVDRLSGGYMGT